MKILYAGEQLTLQNLVLSDGPIGSRVWMRDRWGRQRWLILRPDPERHPTWVHLVLGWEEIKAELGAFRTHVKKAIRALPRRIRERGAILVTMTKVATYPEGAFRMVSLHHLPKMRCEGYPAEALRHFVNSPMPEGFPRRLTA